jgi:uncharacterized protein (DUF58 family)
MLEASHCGTDEETTEEYCISIAASLVKKYIENGKNVGLLSSGERSFLFLPDTGETHEQELRRALAVIKADSTLTLDELLASQEERFEPGAAIVVISPSANIQGALRRMAFRNTVVTAILIDAASFGGEADAAKTAHTLIAMGMHAYIVRRGTEIVRALDSRYLFSPVSSSGLVR